MFDHLIRENDLKGEFQRYGLGDRDVAFIKALIKGEATRVWRSVLGTVTYITSVMSHRNTKFNSCNYSFILQGVPKRDDHTGDMNFLYEVNVYDAQHACEVNWWVKHKPHMHPPPPPPLRLWQTGEVVSMLTSGTTLPVTVSTSACAPTLTTNA